MITDNDIKKLQKTFVTKEELKQTTTAIIDYIDFRLEPVDKVINNVARIAEEIDNKLVKFKDEILHEVVAMREELTITLGHRDMLEDHEIRITKLEKKTPKSN